MLNNNGYLTDNIRCKYMYKNLFKQCLFTILHIYRAQYYLTQVLIKSLELIQISRKNMLAVVIYVNDGYVIANYLICIIILLLLLLLLLVIMIILITHRLINMSKSIQ